MRCTSLLSELNSFATFSENFSSFYPISITAAFG